jgi:ketosteroid isomerase-like protein
MPPLHTPADPQANTQAAHALMAAAERAFRSADLDTIIDLFDENVEVVFADFPPMRGKANYRTFLEARFKRQRDYKPVTTVEFVGEDVIGASWEATWVDAKTGEDMRGRGCEFVRLSKQKIVRYTVSFNAWPQHGGASTPIV